jgi:hypothetical protein
VIDDKKTIGLTSGNKEVMERLLEQGFFKEGIPAAKFALAYAIKLGIQPKGFEGIETIWNIGSFDPMGELRDLISVFSPNAKTPYRVAEELVNVGFEAIGEKIKKSNRIDLADLIGENL